MKIPTAMRKRLKNAKLTRRDVLVGAGSVMATAALTLGREIAFEEGYDAVKAAATPAGHGFVAFTFPERRFRALATQEQKTALACWREKIVTMPALVGRRTSTTYRGADGRQWIKHQGAAITLWRGFSGREMDIPMTEQPDPAYGAWAERRMLACAMAAEPRFQRCRGFIWRDGAPVLTEYTALLLPYDGGVVKSVTARV